MSRLSSTHVVVVGAGPYGLSIASHLREAGVPFRIFGEPMKTWATQMPAGMKLKSDGFASNLSSGGVEFTLEDWCQLNQRPYHATQVPVAVEDFVSYGREFQRRFVPSLDTQNVAQIEREGERFRVTVEGGEQLYARHIVLATGVSVYQYVPEIFRKLPPQCVSHSSDHQNFAQFTGSHVTVIGRGASSLNAAVLLKEAGIEVTVLARSRKLHVHSLDNPEDRPLLQKLMHPMSPLGPSMRSWLSCHLPQLFRALPSSVQRLLTYKHLGPAGGSALQGRFADLNIRMGWSVRSAQVISSPSCDTIQLKLANEQGEIETLETSHIIAGTGYRIDLTRLKFLSDSILARVRLQKPSSPRLSSNFESTVKHLYFVGPAAMAAFGPLQRFVAGNEYAATRLTTHIAADYRRLHQVSRKSTAQQSIADRTA